MLNIIINIIFILSAYAETTPSRIVSLSPAQTETLIAIGLGDKIVCAALPFNDYLKNRNIKSVGFYHKPSIELIISCKPDLITTTYAGTPPEVYDKLKSAGYNILIDKPKDLASIKDFILNLSKIFKIKIPKVIKELDSVCTKRTKTTGIMIIGFNPLIVAGKESFVSDAMRCAGIKNNITGLYPRMSIEKLLEYNDDMIIVALKDFKDFKDYKLLSSAYKGRIVYIDPDTILLPSTGIIKGIRELESLY